MGKVRDLLRDLTGRNAREFSGLLGAHLAIALEAVQIAEDAATGRSDSEGAAAAIETVEQRADQERNRLIDALRSSLTTPLDREDLFRLSRAVDDIVDTLRDFVQERHVFGVAGQDWYTAPLDALREGMEALLGAVEGLDGDPDQLARTARDAKHVVEVHHAYRQALGRLFSDELTMETLKHRELLRRLDIVGLRLKDAADVLADAALKRG